MGDKSFVFQYEDVTYYYKDYSDGTSDVYLLSQSCVPEMFYLHGGYAPLIPQKIPPREEWTICSGYRLGWMRLYDPNFSFVEMVVVLCRWEKIRVNLKNSVYLSLQDCLVYACKHVLSPVGNTVLIRGVGTICNYNGVIHLHRQPRDVWKVVE